MEDIVRKQLFEMQDQGYKEFQRKLIPTMDSEKMIGIRTPILRKYVKEIKGSDVAEKFLSNLPHTYYEENNVHAFLIELIEDYEECIKEVNRFLPYIDNWATCDSMSPKIFKKNKTKLLDEIRRWIDSDQTYTIRFGVEMLMKLYLDVDFKPEYLEWVARVSSEAYYVKMMSAWYFATALAKQYEDTIVYIEEQRLEKWTHNKAIQKAIESFRITDKQKEYLRTLKIRAS